MKINELGFAAFLIVKGYKLKSHESGNFHFETEESEESLRVEWVNSDFAKFDKVILDLKRFKN